MGLDSVEIVLQTEDVFGISLPDVEVGSVRTVGDLYRLVLVKLDLKPPSDDVAVVIAGRSRFKPPERHFFKPAINYPLEPDPKAVPWTAPEVWATLVTIIQDQLAVPRDEITESARFSEDLRCD